MNEWKALSARITLLTTPSSTPQVASVLDLYRRIWGGDPDNFQKPPNPLMPSVAQGKRAGLTVACSVFPTRIDFNITPAGLQEEIVQPALQLIEDTKELHAELMRISSEIGKSSISNSVNRVAVFAQFVNIRPNVVEANSTLMSIMPLQYRVSLTDEEGFVLQVSRPRQISKVGNFKMNLVTKWSVEQLQVVTFAVPMGGLPTSFPAPAGIVTPVVKVYVGASVAFDCNTVPSDEPLSPQQQSSLLLEGLTLAATTQREWGLSVEGF